MIAMWKWLRRSVADPKPRKPLAPEQAASRAGDEPASNLPSREDPVAKLSPTEFIIRSVAGTEYIKDATASPFWADVSKMQPGTYVKYESVAREWHVFLVVEGPMYGRNKEIGLSVVVRRVTTGEVFTMRPDRLRSCPPSFVAKDGTRIAKGESWRGGYG